jgi:hypothetical protein
MGDDPFKFKDADTLLPFARRVLTNVKQSRNRRGNERSVAKRRREARSESHEAKRAVREEQARCEAANILGFFGHTLETSQNRIV